MQASTTTHQHLALFEDPMSNPCFSEEQVDLSLIKHRLETKEGWSPEQTDKALSEYRRFLFLMIKYPGSGLVPSLVVDEVWHAHILHTKLYCDHTHKMAGRYLHHSPTPPAHLKEATEGHRGSYENTIAKYTETFGGEIDVSVWPKLSDEECDECGSIRCRAQCPSCNQRCNNDD